MNATRSIDALMGTRLLLGAASLAAGLIHAAVVPEHLEEGWAFGLFFILIAGFQVAWALVVVVSPSVAAFSVGAAASGSLVVLWAVSRTVGLPIGPEPWTAEAVGNLDLAATLLAILLATGSSIVLRGRAQLRRASLGRPAAQATWNERLARPMK